jgi:transposase
VVLHAAVIEQLQAKVAALRAEKRRAETSVGMNSTNSSKPPFIKPAPKSPRVGVNGSRAGQAEHPGSTLVLVADPDERVRQHRSHPLEWAMVSVESSPFLMGKAGDVAAV